MITYFRWGGSLQEVSPALPQIRLSVIDLLADFGLDRSLGDRFRLLDPVLRSAQAILFRSSSPLMANLIKEDAIIKEQLTSTPCGVIAPTLLNGDERLRVASVPGFPAIDLEIPLTDIRALETLFLLRNAGAILQWEHAHFALPNRTMHADSFIQTAYMLGSVMNVDRLSDWIAPHFSATTALIADTRHLLPLLMKLRLDGMRRFGVDLPIDTLDIYPAEHTSIGDSLRQLQLRQKNVDNILLLISVNSSGHLASAFSLASSLRLKVIVLCHSSETDPPPGVECFSRLSIPRWPVREDGQCAKCKERKTIHVDPATFECKPEQEPVILKPDWSMVESHQEFWRWVNDSNAIKLHAWLDHVEDGLSRPRHHPIYFDMSKLVAHYAFRAHCLTKIREAKPPDLILIPNHVSARLLQEFAREAFGENCEITITEVSLGEPLRERIRRGVKRILLFDDAFITGGTLLALKNQIYYTCQLMGDIPDIDVFVLLARPCNADWKRTVLLPFYAREDRKPHVKWGHLLYAPKSGVDSCPWCEERILLEKNRNRLSGVGRSYLDSRIRLLEGEILGPAPFAPAERLAQHLLTLGSFFGDLNEITAFSAASCVAHELSARVDSARGLFVHPEIDLALVIEGYYEAVLLAGMLRTFPVRHLRSVGFEQGIVDRLARRPANLSYPGTVGELAWAAVQGKLAPQPVLSLIGRFPAPDSALVMLKELMIANTLSRGLM